MTHTKNVTTACCAVIQTGLQTMQWSEQRIRWISGFVDPTSTISLILKDMVRDLWDIIFAYETSQLLAVETNKQPW